MKEIKPEGFRGMILYRECDLAIYNDYIIMPEIENRYVEIWVNKLITLFDNDGKEYVVSDRELTKMQMEECDFISDRGVEIPFCDPDWRRKNFVFRNKEYVYVFKKRYSYAQEIGAALELLYKSYGILKCNETFYFNRPNDLIYSEFIEVNSFYIPELDFSKFPFLERVGYCYYRVVSHREALTVENPICEVLSKSIPSGWDMQKKVKFMIKSLNFRAEFKKYTKYELIEKIENELMKIIDLNRK